MISIVAVLGKQIQIIPDNLARRLVAPKEKNDVV